MNETINKQVLVVLPMNESEKDLLKSKMPEASFLFCKPTEVTEELVKEANIIIGNVSPTMIKGTNKLEWIQLNSAGTDGYCEEGVLPKNALLTNATGAYGLALSEHMLGMVFEIKKKLNLYYINQLNREWKDEGKVTAIEGSTTLVVGLGDIGGSFAKKMKALGSYTIGIRRTSGLKPEYLDELCTMDELEALLSRADIVALSLPNTKETYHLFNKEMFMHMKMNAIIINVGRGNAICTDDLCEALEEGVFAGAGLDVTDPEPLPSDHKLWNTRGVVITPHVSGAYHLEETRERIVKISIENLERFLKGDDLQNIVDFKTGYRKR